MRIITPDLIPHSEFHKGSWLLPVDREDWYYFRRNKKHNTIHNKRFIGSVDRPLRPLIEWLRSKGIRTTPSCSGHHLSKTSIAKIYHNLELDEHIIRNEGLLLKDVESGKCYCYQDKKYALPWSQKQFIDGLTSYQQNGVLGIRTGRIKKLKEKILELPHLLEKNDMHIKVKEEGSLIFIFTCEASQAAIMKTWKLITKEIIA
jgi:hypothetical protein